MKPVLSYYPSYCVGFGSWNKSARSDKPALGTLRTGTSRDGDALGWNHRVGERLMIRSHRAITES